MRPPARRLQAGIRRTVRQTREGADISCHRRKNAVACIPYARSAGGAALIVTPITQVTYEQRLYGAARLTRGNCPQCSVLVLRPVLSDLLE